jgi:hypothetical protein
MNPDWRQPDYDPKDESFWFHCQGCSQRLNIKEQRQVRAAPVNIRTLCPDCALLTPCPCERCGVECGLGNRQAPGGSPIDEGYCPRCLSVVEGRFVVATPPRGRLSPLADTASRQLAVR